MNREIKFRAWDKENRSMHDVEFLGEEVLKIRGAEWENRENFEVMQYTGIMDKNGKEIYEGDIVQVYKDGQAAYKSEAGYEKDHDSWSIRQKLNSFTCPEFDVCTFDFDEDEECPNGGHCSVGFSFPVYKEIGISIEVIGNVFDNPDLLEVADAKTDGV